MTPTIRLIAIALLMATIVLGADFLWGLTTVAKLVTIICVPLFSVGGEILKAYLDSKNEDDETENLLNQCSYLSNNFNDLENRVIRCETILSLIHADEFLQILGKLEKRIENIETATEFNGIETILDEKQPTKQEQKSQEYLD